MPVIYTDRLAIIPFSLDLVRASLQSTDQLARLLAREVPTDWPGADFAGVLPLIAQRLTEDPTGGEWTRLIIQQANRTLIGDIGFLSPPGPDWVVEIGYSIVPPYRRQGYAFEAAQAMLSWAFSWPSVRRVIASCEADNLGSIRVLEKLGMRRVDSEDKVLRWELISPHDSGQYHL